ncbi:hypothetical protein PI124_g24519 [Phytophthora idaei]|nr:hypothetical protein PI125_g26911 [Phytophthora idaei]KAG3230383.1 hypothetical protein PI124_g24519 [Phytophthora idaei]
MELRRLFGVGNHLRLEHFTLTLDLLLDREVGFLSGLDELVPEALVVRTWTLNHRTDQDLRHRRKLSRRHSQVTVRGSSRNLIDDVA